MGRKSRTAVLKRQREVRKAEKAAMKREKRTIRDSEDTGGQQVATVDDLAGYGFDEESADESDSEPPGRPERAIPPDSKAPRIRGTRRARAGSRVDHVDHVDRMGFVRA